MSRSRKKTPITGWAKSRSVQGYKHQRVSKERAEQRRLLHKARQLLEVAELSYVLVPWNEWLCERDGKMYFDPAKYPKLMRK